MIKNKPLVSILITVYNGEELINKTIESLVSQTYSPIEIVVVDDGSADNSPDILKKLASSYPIIKLFFPGRLGRSKALNYGLNKCQGRYIAINDADDFSKPTRIEKQVQFLEAHPEIGLLGTWKEIREGSKRWVNERPIEDQEIRKYFAKGQPIQHSSVMFRKEVLHKVGGYNEDIPFLLDRDIFLRVANYTKMHQLPEPLIVIHRTTNQFFNNKYTGVQRSWMSTKYQLMAVNNFGFPFWFKIEIWLKFFYSLLLHQIRKFKK